MKKETNLIAKLSIVISFILLMNLPVLQTNAQYNISGNVLNDINGISDNLISGTPVNPSGAIKVALYNNTTHSVVRLDNNLNGSYSFSNVPTGNYTLYLTASPVTVGQSAVPDKSLPNGWIYAGENVTNTAGYDPIINGELPLGNLAGNMSTKFGIASYTVFECTNDAYQVAGEVGQNSDFYSYDVNTGVRTKISDLSFEANALGFSPKTDAIWAIDQAKNTNKIHIVLIDKTGKSIFYKVPDLPNKAYYIGCIIANDYFLVSESGDNDNYYVIDVDPERATFMQLVDPKNNFQIDTGTDTDKLGTAYSRNLIFHDLSYDYNTGLLRGVVDPPGGVSTRFRLFTLDPLTGNIDLDSEQVTGGGFQNETVAYGSIFSYDMPGKLYVFSNKSNGAEKGRFFEIDIATRTARLLSTTASATNNDGTNCTDASLPVAFGSINAAIQNSVLSVKWTSLSETVNSYFEVEASEDGNNFVSIGKVNSKAIDGNSNDLLMYEFIQPTSALTLGISIAALFALCMGINLKRKQKIILLGAFVALIISFVSCNQDKGIIDNTDKRNLFVRIVQVDKDGTKRYSKIVKAHVL